MTSEPDRRFADEIASALRYERRLLLKALACLTLVVALAVIRHHLLT
jgi:hypothetical protein